jgi:hypothetical protein
VFGNLAGSQNHTITTYCCGFLQLNLLHLYLLCRHYSRKDLHELATLWSRSVIDERRDALYDHPFC